MRSSSEVERRIHNPEAAGSIPVSATTHRMPRFESVPMHHNGAARLVMGARGALGPSGSIDVCTDARMSGFAKNFRG